MADNTTLNPGSGGDTLVTDDLTTAKVPVSKIMIGTDGVNDGYVAAGNPLPVSGTVTATVTGGATEAKQDTQITSLQLLDDAVFADNSAFSIGSSKIFAIGGVVTDGTGIVPEGMITFPALTSSRELRVSIGSSISVSNAGLFAVQASQTGTWTVDLSATDNAAIDLISTNLRQADLNTDPGTDNWLGVGLMVATSLGAVAVSQGNPLPVSVIGSVSINEPVTVDGAVTVSGSVSITGSVAVNASQSGTWVVTGAGGTFPVTNAGTFAVQAAQSGTWTVQIGNTPNSTPILVSERPATSGGLSVSSFLSTAAVQATAVKASAGQIYSLSFFNKGAAAVYLRLYNMTTAPGTGDTPIWRAIIPGNTAGAGLVKHFPNGLEFSTGIGFRCTGAIADNDATALAANEVTGNIEYK